MNQRHRLYYYLILNVFVSACVTATILFWYDRTYRAVRVPGVPAAPAGATMEITLNPQADTPQILSVIGAGTLSIETVVIDYNGKGEIDLTNWHLKDSDGNVYTFPHLKLFEGGAVQVYTASGTNSPISLYWGLRQAIWQSGEIAELTDPQDNPIDTYSVP